MPNKLADQQSPYLLQHKDNPVDWYPWSDEAFRRAHEEDKPIFLSIGYSTCHWCHVMEHESFEDAEVARLMNDAFVSIKVDREERPDVDGVYMTVCQMMTGQGGWPLTILMTPDKRPFHAATYIPRTSRFGRVGMMDLIPRIRDVWENRRDDVMATAGEVTDALKRSELVGPSDRDVAEEDLRAAYEQLEGRYDPQFGGFAEAPKFPSPHNLLFLLRYWHRTGTARALEMVVNTLDHMRLGGLFDHIGFGFHRYSTDRTWLVPHFEKMLYDQAMLAMAYTEAYQVTKHPAYRQTAEEIFEYVYRDLRSPEGAFYSAEDADSEGEEGKFYVWSVDEVRDVLDPDEADLVIDIFGLTSEGNFEEEATRKRTGDNIIHLHKPIAEAANDRSEDVESLRIRLRAARDKLFARREERIRPGLDDKILVDWNGLMIAALAKAAAAYDHDAPRFAHHPLAAADADAPAPPYAHHPLAAADADAPAPPYAHHPLAAAARAAASLVLEKMRTDDGRLLHRYRNGEAAVAGHLDDYAYLIWGLLELYEADFDPAWLEAALDLTRLQIGHFWDDENGGFFFTADDAEELLVRRKETYDGALPSGNAVSALNLLRLERITGDAAYGERADALFRAAGEGIKRMPSGFTGLLTAADFGLGPTLEIVVVGHLAAPHDSAAPDDSAARDDSADSAAPHDRLTPDDAATPAADSAAPHDRPTPDAAGVPQATTAKDLLQTIRSIYLPNKIVLFRPVRDDAAITTIAPFTAAQTPIDGKATAYVCRNFTCDAPVTSPSDLEEALTNTLPAASH